jgi:hypothetical protein
MPMLFSPTIMSIGRGRERFASDQSLEWRFLLRGLFVARKSMMVTISNREKRLADSRCESSIFTLSPLFTLPLYLG